MIKIKAAVLGGKEIAKALMALEQKVRSKVLKEVVKAGVRPTVAAVKAAVPVETGALKKAIGDKQKQYRRGAIHVGIVGARVGQKREVTRTFSKRGKQRIKLKRTKETDTAANEIKDPAHYLHLANKGRKALRDGKLRPIRSQGGRVFFSRNVRAAKGKHFMEGAFKASQGTVRGAMLAALWQGVEQAIRESAVK